MVIIIIIMIMMILIITMIIIITMIMIIIIIKRRIRLYTWLLSLLKVRRQDKVFSVQGDFFLLFPYVPCISIGDDRGKGS